MPRAQLWLVIDSNYLCYRALHSTGELQYHGRSTGVAFGFLKEVERLSDRFEPDGIAFTFDSQHNLRKDIYPEYKESRKKDMRDETSRTMWEEFFRQVQDLRKTHLPGMGFGNVFCRRGFEADDLIASICENIGTKDRVIIVSSDQDLYQCLGVSTSIWDLPSKSMVTFKSFRDEWGLFPFQWAEVKAFAGCSSDNIDGMKGVGNKTAAKWVRGEIGKGDKLFNRFLATVELMSFNTQLVRLPFKGTPEIRLTPDTKQINWQQAARSLGSKTLKKRDDSKRTTRRIGGNRYGKS